MATQCPFSARQMKVLTSLCDTLLPSVDDSAHTHQESALRFFRTSASMAATPLSVGIFIGEKVMHPKIWLFGIVLTLLSTRLGSLILCGRLSLMTKFPYFHVFSELSSHRRQRIILSWARSYFIILRIFYYCVKMVTLLVFFTQVNEKNENVSWEAIGYCGPDPSRKTRKPMPEAEEHEDGASEADLFGPLWGGIINLSKEKEAALERLHNLGFPTSVNYWKNNHRVESLNPSLTLKADAVVIGSGSGGGIMAGVLAKAGYKVIVLEKGSYFARGNLSLLEGEAMDQMYLGNGLMGTENLDIVLLAGSTVGGGSTINWSASFRTPPHVMKEWSETHKLELFESKAYAEALDVVCQRMGVGSEFQQESFNNMVLRKGCENLGYPVESIPNNAGSDHWCGWCCLGCKDGRKKGTAETWLVDMVESGNGVILAECEAMEVITDKTGGLRRAVGVAFGFENQGVKEMMMVECKVTVVACGAILTPPLLKRSGLKNANIGRNLHLHPVAMAWGYFPESSARDAWPEAEKKSYDGRIMSAMSTVDANWGGSGSGYGTVIQTPALHPGMFSVLMPWISGSDIKNRMLKFSRTAHIFALARDKGSGVIKSPTCISYEWDMADKENLSKGTEKLLRILAAAGAEEIGTHHNKGRVLKVKQADEQEFERFVKEESLGPLTTLETPMCSAHQMASCRMGVDPKGSVVNPKGETWEVERLFVADSSVFPTALGVNPMVTVQAIAYCTAQSVLQVLGHK